MLRSQVYSLVEDRTMVDRELDELRYAWTTSPEFLHLVCMSLRDCACFIDLTDHVMLNYTWVCMPFRCMPPTAASTYMQAT